MNQIFNGFYTFKSAKTGAHRTIRIRTQKENASFRPGARLVGVLTGSDNENAYTQVGELTDSGLQVWNKQKGSALAETATFILNAVVSGGHPGGELNESRRCLRCNRLLTTPESCALGIGPECAKA